jgi:hypothetical protein
MALIGARGSNFWKRQFSPDVTKNQFVFDILFGVFAPLLCIIYDPFVFRYSPLITTSHLVEYRVFAYIGIILGTITLTSWLTFGSRIGYRWIGFFAGILLFGALFASAGGLLLLPFSVFGLLLYGIGLLGFIPFVTGFVFLRNGLRALSYKEQMQSFSERRLFWVSIVLGLSMIIAIPIVAQWQTSQIVSQGVQLILSGNDTASEKGVQSLKSAFWCDNACYKKIVDAYLKEKDETRRTVLAKAYQEITGHSIESVIKEMLNTD